MPLENDDLELRELLEAALDLPPEQQRSYLEGNASRPELARAVVEMLHEEDELGTFLNQPVLPSPSADKATADENTADEATAKDAKPDEATADSTADDTDGKDQDSSLTIDTQTTKVGGLEETFTMVGPSSAGTESPVRLSGNTVVADRYRIQARLGGGAGGVLVPELVGVVDRVGAKGNSVVGIIERRGQVGDAPA